MRDKLAKYLLNATVIGFAIVLNPTLASAQCSITSSIVNPENSLAKSSEWTALNPQFSKLVAQLSQNVVKLERGAVTGTGIALRARSNGTVIVVTANHTLDSDKVYDSRSGTYTARNGLMFNPWQTNRLNEDFRTRAFFPSADPMADYLLTPIFSPSHRTADLSLIQPADDFALALLTSYDFSYGEPKDLARALDQGFLGSSAISTIVGTPEANDTAIVMGFATKLKNRSNSELAVSAGCILPSEFASELVSIMEDATDSSVPYDANVEFIALTESAPGVSGGPVYSSRGELIGIVVRDGFIGGRPYVRAVKIAYIMSKLTDIPPEVQSLLK